MKKLIWLVLMGLSSLTLSSESEGPLDLGTCPSSRYESLLDLSYCWITTGVSRPVETFDNAFKEKDKKNSSKRGRVRVHLVTGPGWHSERGRVTKNLVGGQVILPNLEDRLSIDFASRQQLNDSEEFNADNQQFDSETSVALALRSLLGRFAVGASWRGEMVLYAFWNIPYVKKWADYKFSARQRFSWDDEDSHSWKNAISLDRSLAADWTLGTSNLLKHEYDPDLVSNVTSIYLKWNPSQWRNRLYVGYEKQAEHLDQPWKEENYWVGFSVSRPFYRRWMRLTLNPQLSWPVEYQQHQVKSIHLRLSVFFDSKYK